MQALRFAIVGGTVAICYMAAYLALLALGMAQPLANALAFLGAVALQYLGQALFTFRAPLRDRAQITRFAAMILCGLLTAALITGPLANAIGLPAWLAALAVMALLPVQNYAFMAFWVFTKTGQKEQVTS